MYFRSLWESRPICKLFCSNISLQKWKYIPSFLYIKKHKNRTANKENNLTSWWASQMEKNPKKIRAHELSTVQLMSVLNRNKHKDIIHSFKCNAKTHSTLDEKKLSLYAEHLHFLIKRAGWLVTSIYRHFTFEQSKLKNKIHNEPKSQAKGNISRRARLL